MDNNHVIDSNKIVLGQCIRVKNVEKENYPKVYANQNDMYIAIQIEDESGAEESECCILLTELEHTDMEYVKLPEVMTKNMVTGRLYNVNIGKINTYLLKVHHWDKRERIIRISKSQLKRAKYRAKKHQQSCTTKSMLTDMVD